MSNTRRRPFPDELNSQSGRSSKQSRTVDAGMEKISLPVSIDLETFVSSRKDELVNLANLVKVKMRKLVSQQLPRHLRRRIVSHNKKRLPKRLQHRYNAEGAKETKRPSRLHRRRPRNLQEEYVGRAKGKCWLETHIWHAKRFRMVDLSGYIVPESSFDKSLRACYRGSSKYCLLNDVSYKSCFELVGTEESICEALKLHTSEETGLSVASKKYIKGNLEGRIWLYARDLYPWGCIGEVSFIWRPRKADSEERTLWIWCHPEVRRPFLRAMKTYLGISCEPEQRHPIRQPPLTGKGITVNDLKDGLNRFRLTGPLAVRTLCETLTQDTSGLEVGMKIKASYYNPFWTTLGQNSLSASSYIQDGQIVGNLVLDPRLHMPTKRMVATVVGATEDQQNVDFYSADHERIPVESEIWDIEVRERVKKEMLAQDQINKLRQKNLVPGTPLDLKEEESRIPILVIFRSGCQDKLGYGRGCDIIIPSGWGRQFFIALNYRGARAAGLRDLNAVTRYCNRFVYPDDISDECDALTLLEEECHKFLAKHFSYPPNKRPSFLTLGISEPFFFPIVSLLRSYKSETTEEPGQRAQGLFPFVVRNRSLLRTLSDALEAGKFHELCFDSLLPKKQLEMALLPVKLICLKKGVPERFARIYSLHRSWERNVALPNEPSHSWELSDGQIDQRSEMRARSMCATGDNRFEIIGFVTSGDRNLTEKTATGMGYVSLNALQAMLAMNLNGIFAFRNQDVFNYHRVEIHIIV